MACCEYTCLACKFVFYSNNTKICEACGSGIIEITGFDEVEKYIEQEKEDTDE
mgnify:CR=1 FL=1